MRNAELKSELIKLASEMVCLNGMPDNVCDMGLPKHLSRKTLGVIQKQSESAQRAAHAWGLRLKKIIDNLPAQNKETDV